MFGRKFIVFALVLFASLTFTVACAPKTEEEKTPTPPAVEKENETTPTVPESSGKPYIDENGNEAIKDDTPPSPPATSDGEELFFAEEISEYETYDIGFISSSMEGMSINDVVLAWGEPDMIQASTYAYFTDLRDLVIHFDAVTGKITKVEER